MTEKSETALTQEFYDNLLNEETNLRQRIQTVVELRAKVGARLLADHEKRFNGMADSSNQNDM